MIELNKETIKAIRIVKGFNPDLRIKLKYIDRDSLYFWIKENRIGILGIDFAVEPTFGTQSYDDFTRQITHAVNQVVNGR